MQGFLLNKSCIELNETTGLHRHDLEIPHLILCFNQRNLISCYQIKIRVGSLQYQHLGHHSTRFIWTPPHPASMTCKYIALLLQSFVINKQFYSKTFSVSHSKDYSWDLKIINSASEISCNVNQIHLLCCCCYQSKEFSVASSDYSII